MSTIVVIEELRPDEMQVPRLYYCDMQIVPHLALWSRESAGYYLQGFTPREGDTRYRDLTSAPFADILVNKNIAATCIACESSPRESMIPLEWLAHADAHDLNVAPAMRNAFDKMTKRALEIRVEKEKKEIEAQIELARFREVQLCKAPDTSAISKNESGKYDWKNKANRLALWRSWNESNKNQTHFARTLGMKRQPLMMQVNKVIKEFGTL